MQDRNLPTPEQPQPKDGEPPLHRAARLGDCAELRRLIALGARLNEEFNVEPDPRARDRKATPFMVAAGSSDGASVETLRVLLELGADPTFEIEGRSAATFACEGLSGWGASGGDAARLRFALQAGCRLPSDPEYTNRLLCDIAAKGDAARVQALLEAGANAAGFWDPVRARERNRKGAERMAEYRSTQPDMFASLPAELRASMDESMRRMSETMYDQQSSAPSSYEIPLFRAAASESVECVRLLLDAGAHVQARDSSRCTAMYHAGSAEVIKALIAAGLPLEDSNDFGWSPLVHALSDGESELPRIRALLEAGADVNATHDRGYTVFMSAVGSNRYPAVLRLLIESGADPHAVTDIGYNAFHAAIDVNGEANAEESVRDTLGYLKELGVNIEQRNSQNQTPLARAIQVGNGIEVVVLCELGADPNAVCPKHECGGDACTRIDLPLLFHAADGIGVHKDVKTLALLKAGADPLAKDSEGFTPLMHVVASLCRDAPDYEASYLAFFKGLSGIRLDGKPMPKTREEFVAEAMPPIQAFVERFASEIPIKEHNRYSDTWRKEKLSCLVCMCAFEGWSRHEMLKRSGS